MNTKNFINFLLKLILIITAICVLYLLLLPVLPQTGMERYAMLWVGSIFLVCLLLIIFGILKVIIIKK